MIIIERVEKESRYKYWNNHISNWKTSGTSRPNYCQKHNLNYYQFNYYIKAQKKAGQYQLNQIPNKTDFIPVSIKESIEKPEIKAKSAKHHGLQCTIEFGPDRAIHMFTVESMKQMKAILQGLLR